MSETPIIASMPARHWRHGAPYGHMNDGQALWQVSCDEKTLRQHRYPGKSEGLQNYVNFISNRQSKN